MGDHVRIFCQIESEAAVANAGAIAKVAGVGGLVLGRADLALSLGEMRLDAPSVISASRAALAAARAAGREAVVVTGSTAELPDLLAMGATMAIVGSDQSFMRVAAGAAASEARRFFKNQDRS